jgi:2-dehydropantoate 2-reductase
MTAAVWWKLVVNGSLNVVASLANLRNGEVLERARTRHWARLAASQVAQTARGLGIEISGRQAMERMEAVARATASNVCSTLADLKSGRPTEYGAINGAILQQASRLGLALDGLRELDRRFAMISTSGIVPAEAAL